MLLQERKKIIKGMKGHVSKIALDRFGSMVRMNFIQFLASFCVFSIWPVLNKT